MTGLLVFWELREMVCDMVRRSSPVEKQDHGAGALQDIGNERRGAGSSSGAALTQESKRQHSAKKAEAEAGSAAPDQAKSTEEDVEMAL